MQCGDFFFSRTVHAFVSVCTWVSRSGLCVAVGALVCSSCLPTVSLCVLCLVDEPGTGARLFSAKANRCAHRPLPGCGPAGTQKKYMDNKKSAVVLDFDESLSLAATAVKRKKTGACGYKAWESLARFARYAAHTSLLP